MTFVIEPADIKFESHHCLESKYILNAIAYLGKASHVHPPKGLVTTLS